MPDGSRAVLTFLDNSTYMMAEDGTADAAGGTGIERGPYTWNPATGVFTAAPVVDTNGQWGFSHPAGAMNLTVSGDGNTLTFAEAGTGDNVSLTRVQDSETNPLVGSWHAQSPDSSHVVITFLDNTTYMMAEDGTADAAGGPGMERGPYTWNPATGVFTASPVVDTSGQWGLSHPLPGTTLNVTVSGDGATLTLAEVP